MFSEVDHRLNNKVTEKLTTEPIVLLKSFVETSNNLQKFLKKT